MTSMRGARCSTRTSCGRCAFRGARPTRTLPPSPATSASASTTHAVAESGDTTWSTTSGTGDPSGSRACRARCARSTACATGASSLTGGYYAAEGADGEDVVTCRRGPRARRRRRRAGARPRRDARRAGVAGRALRGGQRGGRSWLVGADPTFLMRFEPDDHLTLVAAWSASARLPIGAVGPSMTSAVDAGRRARSAVGADGSCRSDGRPVGEGAAARDRPRWGVPIVVDGACGVWLRRLVLVRSVPRGHRDDAGAVHGAVGDGDLQRRGAGRGGSPRGGAGRAAARGDARRARVAPWRSSQRWPRRGRALASKTRGWSDTRPTRPSGWSRSGASPDAAFPVGSHLPLGGKNIVT